MFSQGKHIFNHPCTSSLPSPAYRPGCKNLRKNHRVKVFKSLAEVCVLSCSCFPSCTLRVTQAVTSCLVPRIALLSPLYLWQTHWEAFCHPLQCDMRKILFLFLKWLSHLVDFRNVFKSRSWGKQASLGEHTRGECSPQN